MKNKNYIYGLLLGIIIIIIDQITKYLLINKYVTIIPNILQFTYTENYGIAFGINLGRIVILLNLLIIIGLLYFAKKEKNDFIKLLPYILVISGSVSNLGNRIFRGYVIDFIDIGFINFPNFNLADICIVSGVIIITSSIIIDSLREHNNK